MPLESRPPVATRSSARLTLRSLPPLPGVWIATFVIWLYTFAGGLVAVAYTDVGQACVGWIGLLAGTAHYLLYESGRSELCSLPGYTNYGPGCSQAPLTTYYSQLCLQH